MIVGGKDISKQSFELKEIHDQPKLIQLPRLNRGLYAKVVSVERLDLPLGVTELVRCGKSGFDRGLEDSLAQIRSSVSAKKFSTSL